MFPFLIGRRVYSMMKKYQIEILNHQPGRIELYSPMWKDSDEMSELLTQFDKEPGLHNIAFAKREGTLQISFDEALTKDYARLEQWMQRLEQFGRNR
ncbi:hypothetical protein [Tumebacillus flagellatus]|uniref:Metal ABC transporter ATPase n=1 Tax=Tumebacillus flagellatus TaxID=1157490 RepID=A0A074LN14_9BACL|nr:hypothetical protein [Tumebacillus flagellatus]KEO81910.1 hypothetical protein EL26_18930 [Tumebacillus flagellatus]